MSTCKRPAGLTVRLVVLRRWEPEGRLFGLIYNKAVLALWQQDLNLCHRTEVGDKIAGEARKRLFSLDSLESHIFLVAD